MKNTNSSSFPVIITVKSWWALWHIKSLAFRLFAQPVVQAHIKENRKALRHWPLWGESTADLWIPLTKGQWGDKYFHLMTASWLLLVWLISVSKRGTWYLNTTCRALTCSRFYCNLNFRSGFRLHVMIHQQMHRGFDDFQTIQQVIFICVVLSEKINHSVTNPLR